MSGSTASRVEEATPLALEGWVGFVTLPNPRSKVLSIGRVRARPYHAAADGVARAHCDDGVGVRECCAPMARARLGSRSRRACRMRRSADHHPVVAKVADRRLRQRASGRLRQAIGSTADMSTRDEPLVDEMLSASPGAGARRAWSICRSPRSPVRCRHRPSSVISHRRRLSRRGTSTTGCWVAEGHHKSGQAMAWRQRPIPRDRPEIWFNAERLRRPHSRPQVWRRLGRYFPGRPPSRPLGRCRANRSPKMRPARSILRGQWPRVVQHIPNLLKCRSK